jgi:hypothetical protein
MATDALWASSIKNIRTSSFLNALTILAAGVTVDC